MNIYIAEDSERVRENLRCIQSEPASVNIVGIAMSEQGDIEYIGAIEHMATLHPDIIILVSDYTTSSFSTSKRIKQFHA